MAPAAPRATPLTIVSGAVAGDDLYSVARSASEALDCPVGIVLAAGGTVVWPVGTSTSAALDLLAERAQETTGDGAVMPPPGVSEAVPVRIGRDIVGVAAAFGDRPLHPGGRAWLEAAAAAAAVTALLRESREGDLDSARRQLVRALAAKPPIDSDTLVAHARRLGVDLAAGAVAIYARWEHEPRELGFQSPALLADLGDGTVVGLLPLSASVSADAFAAELSSHGLRVALSAPRTEPGSLHEALREAQLMAELGASPDSMLPAQEETYRLLVGVLLREPEELRRLQAGTVSPLARYDSEHDSGLLATLQTFLAHDGSTSETAEAMSLHRHTVGYRLARVHEVSGLSPYESDGRERLSLGLKAHQILKADARPGDIPPLYN